MPNYTKHYDWKEIQIFYDAPNSYTDTRKKFGFAKRSWEKAVSRGEIVPRDHRQSIEDVLSGIKKFKSRHAVRTAIIKYNIMPYLCTVCGNMGTWNNQHLALHLDHINGVNDDDRLENLRFLCPNCHSQTDTYAGKGKGNGHYNRTKKKYKTRGFVPKPI
jgi:5-methylcytosine-specific restriction endonuclease McrA